MPSLNLVQFMGNLGRDPEMRYTPNGRPVTQFTLAVNRRWQQDGEWKEETEWVRAVVWGDAAERAAEQLKKGSLAYIQGRMQTRSWEDQESGMKRYATEIIVDRFLNLTKRDRDGNAPDDDLSRFDTDAAPRGGNGARATSAAPAGELGLGNDLDDLPF